MTTNEDEALWASYAKGVQRIGEKETEEVPAKPKAAAPKGPQIDPKPETEKEIQKEESAPILPIVQEEPLQTKPADKAPSFPHCPWKKEPLDLRVERNMSLGDIVIEAKLDLHGQTEQAAYEAFRDFIESQRARGKRMLLVITGKGADGTSVLRANLPRWCDTAPFAEHVLAVRTAATHHGGEGAYYVLLRKKGA